MNSNSLDLLEAMKVRTNALYEDILSIDKNVELCLRETLFTEPCADRNFLSALENIRNLKYEEYQRIIKWMTLLEQIILK